MAFTHDVLVLGRGIAGAVLAEECRHRGLRVHVFDRPRPGRASAAAAGVVNPVVLRRDVLAWRAAEMLPLATAFYTRMQEHLGIHAWHPLDLVKVFPTPREAEQWARAMQDPATAPFVSRTPCPELEAAPLKVPHGHGTVHGAAWLDVALLLEAQRTQLLREGGLTEEEVAPEAIAAMTGGVRIGERSAPWLVHAEGPFAPLPGLVPVKGETLLLRIRGLHLTRMVHRGVFLLPLGEERYRVGATFAWNDVWSGPTAQGRDELLRRLCLLTDADVEVLGQAAGVRPTTRDRRPLLGVIAPQRAVLNGLGARGVSLAPWCAQHLLDHLFGGVQVDPEVQVGRAFPSAS